MIDIDAQQLSQQRLLALSMTKWIATTAAVTEPEVQKSVGAKCQLAGFVIAEIPDLVHSEQDSFASHVSLIRSGSRNRVFGDYRLNLAAGVSDVIHVELATRCKIGMKGNSEQSHLAARRDLRADIKERLGCDCAILKNPDLTSLLNDKESPAAVIGLFEIEWRAKSSSYEIERKHWRRTGGRGGR